MQTPTAIHVCEVGWMKPQWLQAQLQTAVLTNQGTNSNLFLRAHEPVASRLCGNVSKNGFSVRVCAVLVCQNMLAELIFYIGRRVHTRADSKVRIIFWI